MIQMHPINPVAKPRQTRRDKWSPSPAVLKYRAFADECRLRRVTVLPGDEITFYLAMPRSWPKKKHNEQEGRPHLQAPDLDNMIKALLDALYSDDSPIWCLGRCEKRWGRQPSIVIKRGNE